MNLHSAGLIPNEEDKSDEKFNLSLYYSVIAAIYLIASMLV